MAILDLLRRTKKRVDDAIPDFNIRQRAGTALRQANQIRQNLPIAREGRRLTDMLTAQRERQAEQARLRREREAQARERRMEESRRRMEEMRAREQERSRKREENQRKLRERASAVGKFAANIPQEIGAGLLRSGAIAADTGVKALQKGEDIITAPLGKGYKERLTKLRQRQSKREDELLGRLQTQELKKGEGAKNYLRETFNKALPEIKNVKQSTPLQRGAAIADIGLTLLAPGAGTAIKQAGKQGVKQIAKQYAKTAAVQGLGGAAGAATMKDATAKDIATGALGGAVFGAGLKGAGDVAPVVARKAGSTLSKARKGIASALQEPKFKPGFASTKPKVRLESKQPKVKQQIPQQDIYKKAKNYKTPERFEKKYNPVDTMFYKMPNPSNKYDVTGYIRVDLSPDKIVKGQGITKSYMLDKLKDGYEKGFTKVTPSYGIWSEDGKAFMNTLVRDGFVDKNYNVLPKIKDWQTKSQLKQIWEKANQSQPKFKKGFASTKSKKGLEPTQPKVEGFTPAPEVKQPEAVSTRNLIKEAQERLQTKATQDINPQVKRLQDLGATKKEANDLIKSVGFDKAQNALASIKDAPDVKNRGGLAYNIATGKTKPREISKPLTEFGDFTPEGKLKSDIKAEPTIKLATKKSPKKLAEEAINKQDTQKVVREKVFGKEPEIPSTPQQRTQFEINQAKRDAAIPQIKAIPKSEADRLKQERVRPEISIKRPQEETDKIIREKVFGKEPTVKLQTKTPTTPRTSRQLAEEAVQKATKEPISPEIAPVARVSTKEDISIGKTPEIQDRFPIKTPASGKTKIDYDKLIDFGTKINDEKSKNALLNRIGLEAERIGAEYTKKTGKGFDNFVDELESGKLDNRVVDLYDEVSNLFNAGNRISTVRNNQITGNIANYFRRIKKEGLEKILTEGSQKNVADILYTPGFAKKRTGALLEYEKTPSVLKAYFDEAIGPISSEQNALVRTANQIKNQIDKSEIVDKDGIIKPTSSIKYVQTIKDNVQATAQNQYNDVKKAIIPGVRSVKNRVFQLADKKFYDDFLKPFNNAQRDYNNALQDAVKLSEKNVRNLAESLGIKISEKTFIKNVAKKTSKAQILYKIAGEYKKQYYGPATETFIKNVANADIKEPNGLQLLEDIAETYIGTEVKKNKFVDRLTGEIRLAYARGALGLNVGSAINNVLELKKVLSRAGIRNTAGAIKDYMAGVDLRNKYGVATTSNIFQDEAFGLLKKVDPALFSLFDFSENTKNRLFLSSLERLGKKKGLQGDDLEYFVLKNFEQYGLAGGRAEDIGLFAGGKRPLTKTAFQFLQYPIKDTVAFADALSNGLKKAVKDKKLNEDLSYAMAYGVTSVAQMAILSQIIGQKGFGSQSGFTPFDFLKQISSGDVTGPGADAILKLGTWVNEIMQPESDKKEENVRKAQVDMNRTFLMGVVPAYNQIWNRTGKYIQDRNRGYFETGSGNVANLVTDDAWGMIRAIILGGNYDPERQKYFVESQRSKSPNLGKQESAIFREVKERGGIETAKEFFAGIMNKREADKALEDLEEGKSIDKPEGMSDEEWIKTQATNEVLLANNMVPNDVLVQYYGRNIEFGKSGAERTKNETKVFNLITTLNNDDKFKKLSDEQKDNIEMALMEKAGISKDTSKYYNKAKNSVTVKYQMAKEEIEDNLSKNPNFDIFNYLLEGRRKINTKQFASQGVLKMLKEDGLISEDEYKVLDKKNFLYLDGEFKDRSVAVKLKAKSGKGGKGKKIKLAPVPKAKDTIEILRLRRQKLPTLRLAPSRAKTPVLKLARSAKAEPKKLTVRKIRVK